MAKNLVIVESPAKAKTIEKILGKDFTVKSSFGHVRDLAKKNLGIDIANGFKPTYEISSDKKKVIKELKDNAKIAEVVWLASDEDREGEAISWHLAEALELDMTKTKRIVFHEITATAILHAIAHPREIDKNLVDAQQARRVLDRLVGFEISPVLWRKVKPSLSAGRVQSVAVRLIVEREKEIQQFTESSAYKVVGVFQSTNGLIKAELSKRFETKKEAEDFLASSMNAIYTIDSVETKPIKKSPSAPFTTSTLQQEASRKLGFSVAKTMMVAQQLYESGFITYMRTDSVNLSDTAIGMAKAEVTTQWGEKYAKTRKYTTKSKGAQEAHEAIRPSYIQHHTIEGDASQKRLYELIWKRTIASQMSDAELEKTTANISISTSPYAFVAKGEVLTFDGFLKVYMESNDEESVEESMEDMLPSLKEGEQLAYTEIAAIQRYAMHPPRYTEASLVKKLEDLGIGRPSTYAPTISTIQKRGYVVNESKEGTTRKAITLTLKHKEIKETEKTEKTGAEKSKLFPTDIGGVVTDFLVEHFDSILDYNFTANVEKEFDEVAQGQKVWNEMIKEFYAPFHQKVENTMEHSEKASGERLVGQDPKTGKNIYVKIGRFGPMAQLGEGDTEEKPLFASLRKEHRIESVTLEEVLELFKLPRVIGAFEDKDMTAAIGKFGPYIRHNSAFYSIPKTEDPLTLTKENAIDIILLKRKVDSEKLIKEYAENVEVKVLNGRYGPYIAIGKNNYKLPADKKANPSALTLEECLLIAKEADKKK